MKDRSGGKISGLYAFAAVLFLTMAWAAPVARAAQDDPYYLEDAQVTGKSIFLFDQDAQHIMLVQDDFKLTVGQRVLSGRDAVIWVRDEKQGEVTVHKIRVYIEGNAQVFEPNGAVTTDRRIVVNLEQQGRLLASGKFSKDKLADFPIYARALKAVEEARHPGSRPATTSAPTETPLLELSTQPGQEGTVASESTTAVLPGSPRKRSAATSKPASRPAATKALTIEPVAFDAENITSEQVDANLTAVVLKGNVYVSRGAASSATFLQLRSEAAVVFLQKNVPLKDVRSPLSSKLRTFGPNMSVAGVYLEGDVQIAMGERSMRAPRAYYDLSTDRGTIIDPVFKTVLPDRNIPICIRAKEGRALSAREVYFKDARVSTSDFFTPSYSIGARDVDFKDLTPYNDKGERVGARRMEGTLKNTTYNINDLPIFYWPKLAGDFTESNTPLRRLSFGHNGRFGGGVESTWDLFRLLGLIAPEGVRADLELDYYSRGFLAGVDVKYARRTETREYSGYSMFYNFLDNKQEDSFGQDVKDIPAPQERGRVLVRHKEFLANDWELQFELSYLSDKNFLQEFFRNEYWAGKEQETILYAKKQRDNWAFTSLLQYRLNSFQTQTESWPDLGFYLIGQPLADGSMTFFNEDHLGLKRFRPGSDTGLEGSDLLVRGDTRNELDIPMHLGPVNLTPYATGRLSGWSDKPEDGEEFRPYGQAGVKSNMHIWRLYNDVQSRLWDVNRLKHIITPEVTGWVAGTDVVPSELFPMDPGVNPTGGSGYALEQHLTPTSGGSFGIYQRLQTKRGLPGKERTVDWMRLDMVASFYSDPDNTLPADGRFFFYRPEYSLARNAVDVDYTWNISDSTAFLADANYDTNSGGFGRVDAGFAVERDPRTRYYVGVRAIRDLDTTVGTFGFNYKINSIYSFSAFEQYDFAFDGGQDLATILSLIRKFDRWYGALSFEYDRTQGSYGLYFTIWPEGIPEIKIGSGRVSPLGNSNLN